MRKFTRIATCDQHNKRGDASVRLVGVTNPQQIFVIEFGAYSRCGQAFRLPH